MQRASRLSVALALGTVYLVWGSTYLAIHFAVQTLPPFLMAAARFLVAGGLLYAWARLRGAKPPARPHWKRATVVGLLLLLGGNGSVVWGEQTIDSSMAALLVTTTSLWMVILAWALYRQRPSGGVFLGVLLGFFGVALLIGPGAFGAGAGVASFVVLGGAFCWALGSVYGQRVRGPESSVLGSAMEMLMGGLGLLLLGLVLGELEGFDPAEVSGASLGGLLYLVVAGSLLAFTAYSWLLRHAPISVVSTYAYVNPVVAVWLGWALAGEALSLRTAIASAIIVASVALITTLQRPRRVPSQLGEEKTLSQEAQ